MSGRAPLRRGLRAVLVALCALAALQFPGAAARDDAFAFDLSDELIGISTGFTGADVLLFGATEGAGDVIVVIRSPSSQVVVRRKERVAGIWVNADELVFDDAPGFYHVAASAPLEELLPAPVLESRQIGAGNIILSSHFSFPLDEEKKFRDALIRNKQRSGLYSSGADEIVFRGDRLFRTRVALPANVPTGIYAVVVYLVSGREIVGASQTSLQVRKVGFGAQVTEFAFQQAPVYGLIAIVIALIAGWFAGFVFRKV